MILSSPSTPERPGCRGASNFDGRTADGRVATNGSPPRSSPPTAARRGTTVNQLLLLLGLTAYVFLPLHVQAQEIASLPHLASYDVVTASSLGGPSPGRILSLAADVTASLTPQMTLSLSFALCDPSAEGVQIFVSTSSAYQAPSSADLEPADDDADGRPRWASDPDKGVWFVDLVDGSASWQGSLGGGAQDGFWVALSSGDQGENGDVEVGLSASGS